jgi:hypothetical protein
LDDDKKVEEEGKDRGKLQGQARGYQMERKKSKENLKKMVERPQGTREKVDG